MEQTIRELAERMLQTGLDDLTDRERRVISRIAKRLHVSRNVNQTYDQEMSFGDRLADRVASFGGSWTFIMLFGFVLAVWVLINTELLPVRDVFDPFPFVFLNLILSMLAAIQAPIILMSQNRQSKKDRIAAGNDYEVNLKAELEIMALHDKLDQLRSKHLEEILEKQRQQIEMIGELAKQRGVS